MTLTLTRETRKRHRPGSVKRRGPVVEGRKKRLRDAGRELHAARAPGRRVALDGVEVDERRAHQPGVRGGLCRAHDEDMTYAAFLGLQAPALDRGRHHSGRAARMALSVPVGAHALGAPQGPRGALRGYGARQDAHAGRVGRRAARDRVLILAPLCRRRADHRRGGQRSGLEVAEVGHGDARSRSPTTSGCISRPGAYAGVVLDESQHPQGLRRQDAHALIHAFARHALSAVLHGHAGAERHRRAGEPLRVPRDHDARGDAGHVLRPRRGRLAAQGPCRRRRSTAGSRRGACSCAGRLISGFSDDGLCPPAAWPSTM